MTSALSGVRVLEMTDGIAGAVAGMLMADFGAEVVIVEHSSGSTSRSDPGYATWDRGKRSLVIDDASPADRELLAGLVAAADICMVRDAAAPAPDARSTSAEQTVAEAGGGRTIVLRMPPISGDVAWAGGHESDQLLTAAMGLALRQSSFTGAPIDPVAPQALYMQGLWAAGCAVAALIEREGSGFGQSVLVSGVHGATIASNATMVIDPAAPTGAPPSGPGGPSPFYSRYECGDGTWIFMGALIPKFQYRALEALGLTDLLRDGRLADGLEAPMDRATSLWLRAHIAERFASASRPHWLDSLDAVDCPSGPLLERSAWLDHPQVKANGLRSEVDDRQRGTVVMPGHPLNLTESPASVRSSAPRRDDARFTLASWTAPAGAAGPAGGPAPIGTGGPLAGIRVLDLGAILAGPLSGALLADLGADVIKVEPPEGDAFRVTGFMHNRGMRSLAIDLRSAHGLEAFHDLVRTADVVIDNYRSGVLERLKIDAAALLRINPAVIPVSITGFGKSGDLVTKPGFDPVLQAMSGMMRAQGGSSEPVLLTLAINDVTAASMSVLGATLALFRRIRTGLGQHVWTSLLGTSVFMQSGELTRFDGRPAPRHGGRDYPGPSALDRYYAVADGWIRLQAPATALPDLRRLGLAPADVDAADDAALHLALTQAFASRARDTVLVELAEAGIPAAPGRTMSELPGDRGLIELQLLQQHRLESGAPFHTAGRYARFGRSEVARTAVAPGLGQHSREVLLEAGVDENRVEALIESGAVRQGTGPLVLKGFSSYR